jgi:LAS superfamily LD-carboxypeptidase LdcB
MKRKENYSSEDSPLSKEELEMLKKSVGNSEDRSKLPPHDTSDRANAVRFAKKNPVLVISAIIIALAIIAVTILGIVLALKRASEKPCTDDYTIYLGTEFYTVDYDKANINEVLFIDMKKIAEFAGFIVSGSKDRVKFTSSTDNYLRFENNTELAVINGAKVAMISPAVVNENECLVPFSFVQRTVAQGLKIRLDNTTNTIKITRQLYNDTKEPADILFTSDGFSVIQAITQIKKEDIGLDSYNIDITPYLQYIDPENAKDFLILANKQNALGKNYVPKELVSLQNELNIPSKNGTLQLNKNAAYALQAMIKAMEADGVAGAYIANEETIKPNDSLLVTSAYRSYDYQENLFNGYVSDLMAEKGVTEEEAIEEVSKTSAHAGESDHQTGLCIDFIMESMHGILDNEFEKAAAFKWLKENAHLYGFILRYPVNPNGEYDDPHPITQYSYESWHYRFVGREAAVEMYQSNMTLEEYLELN